MSESEYPKMAAEINPQARSITHREGDLEFRYELDPTSLNRFRWRLFYRDHSRTREWVEMTPVDGRDVSWQMALVVVGPASEQEGRTDA